MKSLKQSQWRCSPLYIDLYEVNRPKWIYFAKLFSKIILSRSGHSASFCRQGGLTPLEVNPPPLRTCPQPLVLFYAFPYLIPMEWRVSNTHFIKPYRSSVHLYSGFRQGFMKQTGVKGRTQYKSYDCKYKQVFVFLSLD